ncbi:proline dehydrogenase [Streptomyces sp. KL116D]|uniref:proline dehydrogenase n=1 Tax=Streptomyces sp. KL116D TaxID=3045152 RepID=UPI0035577528
MDAGLAAVLGAGVGSLATLGAAFISGRSQAQAQHRQWRRQQRRDACAGYLSALHDRDIAMDYILAALRADEPALSDVDDGVRRFVDLAREVHRSLEVVVLEGPAGLAAVADRVTRASHELAVVMRRMVDDAHAGERARRAEDLAVAAQREHLLYQTVQDFRRAARDTINGGA